MTNWHILTGEYPPQPGGVSDYTRLIAAGLAREGDEVHVWAPECVGETPVDPGVAVRRLPGVFGRRAVAALDAALRRERRPFRLLVQYVPHMYGWKGMNLPFCAWLTRQRHARPWLMFHEVAFPWTRQPRHQILALTQRAMAAILARTAERVFVSIPAWGGMLRSLAPRLPDPTWLPIPSTVAESHQPLTSCPARQFTLGHFGTFGGAVAEMLANCLPRLLSDPSRTALLVGRGGEGFAENLIRRHPALTGRVRATGGVPAGEVAAGLGSCDLLLQPFPDGVSSRRTSVMAGLALGLPIVSTIGDLSEPIWAKERLLALAPAGDEAAFVAAANVLLGDAEERHQLGERARRGYAEWFSLERTIATLRDHDSRAAGFIAAVRTAGMNPAARRPRVAFVVNGEPGSAMGHRAAAFAQRLAGRYDLRLFHRGGGKLASLARLTRELYLFRPAVAYVFDMAWSGVGAGLLHRILPGTRLVIDTGDAITALARSMGRSRVGVAMTHALERASLCLADRIVVRGSYHKEWLAARRVRADFVPDGVEMDLFAPKAIAPTRAALTVGLVGSSVWSETLKTCYGLDLVELIHLLEDRPVVGVMIGGGSGIEVLKDRCRRYGITDRVRFLGYVPYHELPNHLAAMDVCLSTQTDDLPGRVRTTGKLPLYLAAGRYVLASRVGEAARVLPDEMLVEHRGTTDPNYATRLAERVERLLADPTLLERGLENVALARRWFDYDVLAERVASVIDSLLPTRR